MKPIKDIHYQYDGLGMYRCMNCGNSFTSPYMVKNKRSTKEYGTKQLMALWAWYNFKRHLQKCWEIPFSNRLRGEEIDKD